MTNARNTLAGIDPAEELDETQSYLDGTPGRRNAVNQEGQ